MRTKEEKKAYDRAYYIAHREHIIARSAAHHKKYRERSNERQLEFYHRVVKWKRVPSWIKERYYDLLGRQNGLCAICDIFMTRPVRDHDHATGLPRSLLCDPCNRMLGAARDNSKTLMRGAEYVKKHIPTTEVRDQRG